MRRSLVIVLLLIGVVSLIPAASAQDYLLATGEPTFNANAPVWLGYVNLANGNLRQTLVLGTFPQRGDLGFTAKLVYDSRIWRVSNGAWEPTNVPNSQGGWRFVTTVDPGLITKTTTTTDCGGNNLTTHNNFAWTDPNGTKRYFPIETSQNLCTGVNVSSGDAFATDSSGYHMYVTNYTTPTVFTPNGNQVSPTSKDTNGNFFTVDANGNIVDTLNRTPVTKTVVGSQTHYDVLNSQGTTSRFTVTTATINVNTSFAQSGVTEYSGTLTVVQSLALPDGSSYSFDYDDGAAPGKYGLLETVTLNTGGQVQYTYTTFSDAYGNANRWVNTRTALGGTWSYTPTVISTCTAGTVGCQQRVTLAKPSGDESVTTFTLDNGAWAVQTLDYTGSASSGTLLKTTAVDYDFSNACVLPSCFGHAYIRATRVTVADPVPSGSISHKAEYTYADIYRHNTTNLKEWNYYSGAPGATPDRETVTTYLSTSAYTNKDIWNRPLSVQTKNAAGTQLELTNYGYDSTSLTSISGITHHDDTGYGTSNTVRGNVTKIHRWVSGAGCTPGTVTCLTTTNTYDTTGQLRSAQNPKGNTINYSYADAFYTDNGVNAPPSYTPGAPTNAYLTTTTFPNSQTNRLRYYFHSGKFAWDEDENLERSFHHYIDPLDRVTSEHTREVVNGVSRGWKLTVYTSPTQEDTYTGITTVTPSTSCTGCRHDVITYNGYYMKTRETLASDPDGQTFTDTTYDTTGRGVTTSNPYRSTTDPTYGVATLQYDGLNRTTRITHPDSNFQQTVYGAAVSSAGGTGSQLCASGTYGFGYPILSIDEAGKKVQKWVDAFGNTIEAVEPDASGALNVATCYKYDALDNLTQVDQGTQTRTTAYDGLSRTTSSANPESGATNFFYTTSAGALCSGAATDLCRTTDARSITTTHTYDSRDRMLTKSYSDTTPTVTYSYDQTSCNGLTITFGEGRRTCMTDGSGTTAWSYNPAGHIVDEKRTVGTITKTISNDYNLDGSVKEKTYPSSNVITYTYSNAQRVTSVKNLAIGKNYGTNITYAPQGEVSSVLENQNSGFAGITYTRSYNNRLQLTAAQATSANGTAFDLGFSYDLGSGVNNGNLATLTNNKSGQSGRSVTYTYDTLNRVATAATTGSTGAFCWGQNFAYDRYGNLLTVGVTKCSAPSLSLTVNGNNQVTNSGFTYDAAGNMTGDASESYAYDAENQVKSSSGVTYNYDGEGWRVKKSNGDLEWHDSNNGSGLLSVFDLSGVLKAEYYYIGSMLFASRSFYYFGDNLSSVRVVTNTTGVVQRESDFYAFGGEVPVVTTVSEVRKFTGKKRDSENNLDYSLLRMYHSTLGRWTSVDPEFGDIEKPQTLNRYNYVSNNPASLVDTFGDIMSSPVPRRPAGLDMPTPCAVPYVPAASADKAQPLIQSTCQERDGYFQLWAAWGVLGGCAANDILTVGKVGAGGACTTYGRFGCYATEFSKGKDGRDCSEVWCPMSKRRMANCWEFREPFQIEVVQTKCVVPVRTSKKSMPRRRPAIRRGRR